MSDRTTKPVQGKALKFVTHEIIAVADAVAQCICGFQSPPEAGDEAALDQGLIHVAMSVATVEELVDALLARPDAEFAEAMDGLDSTDRSDVRREGIQAALLKVAEIRQREATVR